MRELTRANQETRTEGASVCRARKAVTEAAKDRSHTEA
jgi:hypothetical protein